MTQPYLLRSLLLREGLIELDQHIAQTQGYGAAEGWEPGLNHTQRDTGSDYDAVKQAKIRPAREGKRGTAEHKQAQRKTQLEHIRYGNR